MWPDQPARWTGHVTSARRSSQQDPSPPLSPTLRALGLRQMPTSEWLVAPLVAGSTRGSSQPTSDGRWTAFALRCSSRLLSSSRPPQTEWLRHCRVNESAIYADLGASRARCHHSGDSGAAPAWPFRRAYRRLSFDVPRHGPHMRAAIVSCASDCSVRGSERVLGTGTCAPWPAAIQSRKSTAVATPSAIGNPPPGEVAEA